MKKILDIIPCVSFVGLFVYLVRDYMDQRKETVLASEAI